MDEGKNLFQRGGLLYGHGISLWFPLQASLLDEGGIWGASDGWLTMNQPIRRTFMDENDSQRP